MWRTQRNSTWTLRETEKHCIDFNLSLGLNWESRNYEAAMLLTPSLYTDCTKQLFKVATKCSNFKTLTVYQLQCL